MKSLFRCIAASLVVAAGAVPLCANAAKDATPVGVDEVRVIQDTASADVVGRIIAPQSGVIAARTNGTIDEWRVQVGDSVEAGAELAVLDLAFQTSQLALARAELKRRSAALRQAVAKEKLAKIQLERIEKLKDSPAYDASLHDLRRQEYAAARAAREQSAAERDAARVSVKMAETDYGYGTVVTPFPAVITRRHANRGAWVNQGDPVVSVVNTEALEIEADVPVSWISGLEPGVEVHVRVDDGKSFKATTRAVIPDENATTRTRPVRFVPDSRPDITLAMNQPVTLMIPKGQPDSAPTVHKDAVIVKGNGAMVFVVRDGAAQPQPVKLGPAVGSRFIVKSGLEPGDIVVTRGNERLRPGQAVSHAPVKGDS